MSGDRRRLRERHALQHCAAVHYPQREDDGTVATRSVRADVRRYPTKFIGGIYRWAKDLTPEEIK
jgi:hypothetical protein